MILPLVKQRVRKIENVHILNEMLIYLENEERLLAESVKIITLDGRPVHDAFRMTGIAIMPKHFKEAKSLIKSMEKEVTALALMDEAQDLIAYGYGKVKGSTQLIVKDGIDHYQFDISIPFKGSYIGEDGQKDKTETVGGHK